jgi:hypothetical protein
VGCLSLLRQRGRLEAMTSPKLGVLIGSLFGLVFVEVNSGALPTGVATLLRVVGVLAFLLVLVGLRRPSHPTEVGQPVGIGFGRGYWVVVAAEVIAIVAGVWLLGGPLDTPEAGVAWVALVVGLHFVALAVVWAQRIFGWLGGSIAVCGVLGLVLAFSDAPKAAIHSVGGVLPGALLLGFAVWGVLRSTPRFESEAALAVGVPE